MLVAMLVMSSLLGRPPQVQSALETLSTCQDLRAEACLFAAAWLKMGGDEAMPEVLKAAPGMTPTGQLLTINAVGTVPSKAATDCLMKLAIDARLDPMSRALALEQLTERPQPPKAKSGPTELALILLHDSDAAVRQAAVRLAVNRLAATDPRFLKVIAEAVQDDDGGVRSEAVTGYGICGCDTAPSVLGGALRDRDGRVRRAAIEGLAMVKHRPAVADLVSLMGMRDPSLNKSIARALRFQSGESFGEDPTEWKRWLAQNP